MKGRETEGARTAKASRVGPLTGCARVSHGSVKGTKSALLIGFPVQWKMTAE